MIPDRFLRASEGLELANALSEGRPAAGPEPGRWGQGQAQKWDDRDNADGTVLVRNGTLETLAKTTRCGNLYRLG